MPGTGKLKNGQEKPEEKGETWSTLPKVGRENGLDCLEIWFNLEETNEKIWGGGKEIY